MAGKTTKKGTRRSKPRGSGRSGARKHGLLTHVLAFIGGTLVSAGVSNAANGIAEMASADKDLNKPGEPLNPLIDGAIGTAGGLGITAATAGATKPLRGLAISTAAGNIAGGAGRVFSRWLMSSKPMATGRSTREQLRRAQLAQGAGQSAREQLATRAGNARALMAGSNN